MNVALDGLNAPRSIRTAAWIISVPFGWLGLKGDPKLPPVVRALTALGPAYIKFGQIMSTRPDIVGPELAKQMRVLQDKLPAFDMREAEAEVERTFGQSVDALFSEFSEPVAAASIAQVHRAVVRETGEDVAVKILRPRIEKDFQTDIDAFYLAAGMIEALSPSTRRLRPKAVINHFEATVHGELDLRMEASASAEFRANSEGDTKFAVPRVYWPLSDRRVFTSEWVEGTSMGDVDALIARGVDLPELAQHIIRMFLNHALRDGFFHADMHQGNLKLAPNGDLIALDFGIMGRIDAYTRRVYAEILIGFLRQDYKRIAEVHFEAGYVPRDQDVDEFAQALRAIGDPIFGYDASQISMARLLAHLFEVTERFGMETRTELILLQRTMVVVEGVARSLDPEINMWQSARDVVERYIRSHVGPLATARDLANTARVLARFGPRLPALAERALLSATLDPSPPPKREIPPWGWAIIGAAIGAIVVSLF
jgi:ubiquinone biosynthesis protein